MKEIAIAFMVLNIIVSSINLVLQEDGQVAYFSALAGWSTALVWAFMA